MHKLVDGAAGVVTTVTYNRYTWSILTFIKPAFNIK